MAEIRFHPGGLAIESRGVRVTLGDTQVLRGVDLHVPRGKIVALIGPNGSGKTTLLRCLLGLQKPDAGEIRLFGEHIGPKVLKRVGYVPQRLPLDRSFILSVREFLALRLPGTAGWFWQSHRRTDALLRDALEGLDLEGILGRPLSGATSSPSCSSRTTCRWSTGTPPACTRSTGSSAAKARRKR